MSDDRFEAWLRQAAREYNAPPDIPPRDAMWDAIQEAGAEVKRTAARQGDDEAMSGSVDIARDARSTSDRRPRVWAARPWHLAAAAVLLLSLGASLGYWLRAGASDRPVVAGTSGAPLVKDSTTSAPLMRDSAAPAATGSTPRVASASTASGGSRTSTYDVAAAEHFTAAEALLMSFHASSESAMDETTRRWARDLLLSTRLLLDSPAAEDARRRRLLSDLETILVQIVQLPSRSLPDDRELIDRAIVRQQVLTRIRTSIPAGMSSGT